MAKFEIKLKKPIKLNLDLKGLVIELIPEIDESLLYLNQDAVPASIRELTLGRLDPRTFGEIDNWHIE